MCINQEKEHCCHNCNHRRASLFYNLNVHDLDIINEGRSMVTYGSGEVILKRNSKPFGLYCLQKGKVKISRLGINGKEHILELKKPVEFIGLRALLSGNHYHATATAMEDASLCIIERDKIFKIIRNNPSLSLLTLGMIAEKYSETELRMISLLQKHIRGRMADALLQINDTYGSAQDGRLYLQIKRSDLAALANMNTANAIRTLSSFAQEGIVEVDKRNIRVRNWTTLRMISDKG